VAIRRRGDKWLVMVEMGKDPATGRRRRASVTMSSRRQAEAEEAKLRHEAAMGLDLEPTRITLAEYLDQWLDAVRGNVAPSTYRRYEGIMRRQVIPYIGGVALSKLRPLHVQQVYARLRRGGRADGKALSPRSLLHVHRVLSEALKQAMLWQLTPRNVCDAVEAPKASRGDIRAIGPSEARELVEAALAEDSPYGDCAVLALHTGLRLGELLGLRWEDINLERGQLTVRRSLQHLPGREREFREPKTAHGRRTIPLGATAISVLDRLRRRQIGERLALGPGYRNEGLVLATSVGTPLNDGNVRRAFYRIASRAGVAPLRFHDLRHTHATLLLTRGVHPKVVSERLGHASIGLTLDTYSHVLPNLQEEAIRDFDAWLSAT